MNNADKEYLRVVENILDNGVKKEDRTGTGTISLFGPQMEFDLQEGFPLLTTKKVPFRIVAEELFWFISGSTNLRDLLDKNVNIWNADAYRWHKQNYPDSTMTFERFIEVIKQGDFDTLSLGDLGPVYGKQWRSWQIADTYYGEGLDPEMRTQEVVVDQLQNVIESLTYDPDSRRHIVSAWNPGKLKEMALPPCHIMFQFYVHDGKLSCKMYQRSGDFFLGVPFNIASYALLTHLVAKMLGLEVGRFIHTLGDAHIYLNHVDQLKEQLTREPKPLPTLKVKTIHDYIEDYTIEDIELIGYDPHGPIKGKLSVGL